MFDYMTLMYEIIITILSKTHTNTFNLQRLSVTILFTVLIPETLQDVPLCVVTCHYLPSVTNKTENST